MSWHVILPLLAPGLFPYVWQSYKHGINAAFSLGSHFVIDVLSKRCSKSPHTEFQSSEAE